MCDPPIPQTHRLKPSGNINVGRLVKKSKNAHKIPYSITILNLFNLTLVLSVVFTRLRVDFSGLKLLDWPEVSKYTRWFI